MVPMPPQRSSSCSPGRSWAKWSIKRAVEKPQRNRSESLTQNVYDVHPRSCIIHALKTDSSNLLQHQQSSQALKNHHISIHRHTFPGYLMELPGFPDLSIFPVPATQMPGVGEMPGPLLPWKFGGFRGTKARGSQAGHGDSKGHLGRGMERGDCRRLSYMDIYIWYHRLS